MKYGDSGEIGGFGQRLEKHGYEEAIPISLLWKVEVPGKSADTGKCCSII